MRAPAVLQGWPDEAGEAARLVLEKRGEPDEATESFLVWHHAAPWRHDFPVPHYD